MLAEVDNTTIQYSGAPAKLNLKAPYRNSTYNNAPVGSIKEWAKTFHNIVTDIADGTTAFKLVDTSVNFVVLGVAIGDIVIDDTGGAWTYVTAIDSPTVLSVQDDIFAAADNYRIFDTPALPDGWVECDGAAIADVASRWNGLNSPNLNGVPSFLRSAVESGTTGGGGNTGNLPAGGNCITPASFTVGGQDTEWDVTGTNAGQHVHLPSVPFYYEVVMIFKIKESA